MSQRAMEEMKKPLPPHPHDRRVLERISYERSEWDQLNWHVRFAQRLLDDLSPGEYLTIKEDLHAIERTVARRSGRLENLAEPTEDEVREQHRLFRGYVTALADMGMISFTLPRTIVNVRWDGWSITKESDTSNSIL